MAKNKAKSKSQGQELDVRAESADINLLVVPNGIPGPDYIREDSLACVAKHRVPGENIRLDQDDIIITWCQASPRS